MKRIAIMRFAVAYGGIEHQIINIASTLCKKHYFILITNGESKFTEQFRKYGKVYIISTTKLFAAKKEVLKILRDESIDIIQSHLLREHFIGCLCKRTLKNIYHIFRVHTYIDCSFISNGRKKAYHLLTRILSKYVDLYLPINNKNYEEIIHRTKIKKSKVRVLHNAVRSIQNATSTKSFDYYDLVMIANVIYGKGHDIAIKALSELVKKDEKYNITFIGSTDVDNGNSEYSVDYFLKMANDLGVKNNIKFIGFTESIEELIKEKSIIILPSYSEGTPNCLLEAMSAKKIVVASAVGGIPEFIENGNNGFLHENKDYKELSQIILKIKELPLLKIEQIANMGYETWYKEYSIEKNCLEFDRIYNEVKL